MTQNNLDGVIERKSGGVVVVTALNEPWSLNFEGVTCVNPDAPEEERVYQKTFHNQRKRIYMPGEYERAIKEIMPGDNVFAFSLNGYSRITPEQCLRYGIKEKDYREACKSITNSVITHLKRKFRGAQLVIPYGGSDTEIDRALSEVAKQRKIPLIGFSCPRYMLYAKDDNTPVYVAPDREEYANRYIQTLDLLISTGGREQTLTHDVLAACLYGKRIHFVDVLNSISSTGGVPATIVESDGRVRVDNAAAAMGRNLSFFSRGDAIYSTPKEGDLWDAILANIKGVATGVYRQKMPARYKFKDS
jgi:hypothetical protein